MAFEIVLMKGANGVLIPADPESAEKIAGMKTGKGFKATVTQYHNLQFHRKLFALAQIGYDAWDPEPVMYKGVAIAKNFERFREDLTIMAGFYETHVNFRGEVRFKAMSWSFGSMNPEDKERLYNSIINVLLQKVLTQYKDQAELENVVNQILGFT